MTEAIDPAVAWGVCEDYDDGCTQVVSVHFSLLRAFDAANQWAADDTTKYGRPTYAVAALTDAEAKEAIIAGAYVAALWP